MYNDGYFCWEIKMFGLEFIKLVDKRVT